MPLPGKLCIGILEEDNPLKSYFRFKPMLLKEGEKYVPFMEHGLYPKDGCIRIVPDKNESYHFKSRMRRMGLFCVVDLRIHSDENDKIRPNKNFREDGSEDNAFIIYSDVVREPVQSLICEVLPAKALEEVIDPPRTPGVLLKLEEGVSEKRFAWELVEGEESRARLVETEETCPLDQWQVFELPGFHDSAVHFAIGPGEIVQLPSEHHEHSMEHGEPHPLPEPRTGVIVVRPAEKPASEKPPMAEKRKPAERPVPEKPVAEAPAVQVVIADNPEKPWLHHDGSMLPRPVDPRLSPAQRILAAQSGLNPRKSRSLQEIIDDKWQSSRLSQLGQAPSQIITGAPVSSPVEVATEAVRTAWNQPDLRDALLVSLSGLEEFGASLEECRLAAKQRDIDQHLEDLEARRLALLNEVEQLRRGNDHIKQQLKQELRADCAGELAEAVKQTQAAKAEQARWKVQADQAKLAAQDARKALEGLTDEALEQKLRELALNKNMLARMARIGREPEEVSAPINAEAADLNALTERVMARFEAAGRPIGRFEALNLLVCLGLSPITVLGGPLGCGADEAADLLADALGWTAAGRRVSFGPGKGSLADRPEIAKLNRQPDVPAMLVLRDANLVPAADPLRGLGGANARWRLCLTVQDTHSGLPLNAAALDRGFMVRLSDDGEAPWQPNRRTAMADAPFAHLSDAVAAVNADAVPEACALIVEQFRKGLRGCGASVSRKALDDAWRYCAVMCACLGEEADPAALADHAIAQRVLPGLLASAPVEALRALPKLLRELPVSRKLMDAPVPVMI